MALSFIGSRYPHTCPVIVHYCGTFRKGVQQFKFTMSAANRAEQAPAPKKKVEQGDLVEAVMQPCPSPVCDIGVNLVDSAYNQDREAVIDRARRANVASMIVTGTCLSTSLAAKKLCEATTSYPLYFTAGVHPHTAKTCNSTTIPELRQLASSPKCVAVGECGLDFNRNFSPQDVQLQWFEEQVKLAVELRKPLFMHCRDAGSSFADVLRRYAPLPAPAVIHCFTGTKEELSSFLELGLCIGITGWICDDRPERGGAELASLLSSIPHDKLMLETDAPYLVPRTIKPNKARPSRNEPALLSHVLQAAAQAQGEEPAALAARTNRVVKSVFGIDY
ncbi:hypothetical protein DUNSADRAFT_9260 [Dunaliella salina]|uniref:TatD related DNase n=1 Tax=Dunaliella salina TaxID=3046 RepID=A0ABQ7GHU8_DUNSA|nr:hypothetical protein DUNSADRAFT_9260 [Dunaliella salina]|eukprot:KAF5834185.1 hypothetical protein DUNSADRAFT_9260 [Dunaliella salina]